MVAVAGMENLLATKPTINVVYTINEPAGRGGLRGAQRAWP